MTITKMKSNNIQNLKQREYVEIFLFCPTSENLKKKNDHAHYFAELIDFEHDLADCTVFLSLLSALHYSDFMNNNHVVFRAYVQHAAIEGLGHGLRLRKGFLTLEQIHGCFLGWTKDTVYINNPDFKASRCKPGNMPLPPKAAYVDAALAVE